MKFEYRLITCVDSENGIGKNNSIPWNEPKDLQIFRTLTNNSAVIMGSKTYQSILDKTGTPLPNRTNIVLTSRKTLFRKNVIFVNSKEQCLQKHRVAWIIGGENVYKQFINLANKIYITRLHKYYDCDTFFPKIPTDFYITSFEKYDTFDFIILTKKKSKFI